LVTTDSLLHNFKPRDITVTIKVADLIAEFLEKNGIRHVFGIIGAGNAHIFDAVHRRGYTQIVCVHHEQAACMAMQIYYRMTGVITAALLTTGGGSTNGITGVVSAWMDSMPGLIISGNENSRFTRADNPLRIWGVQGYDSTAMVEKVTKYTSRVLDPKQIEAELAKAYYIAGQGRPGPVWVDVPMDIQSAQVEPDTLAIFEPAPQPTPQRAPVVNLADVAPVVLQKLRAAKRPVLWLGNGIRLANAVEKLEPLIAALGVPTLVSWAGIDMVDSSHKLVYGRAGVYGQRAANFVLQNADIVLAIGTRLAIPQIGYMLDEFAREAELLVVDIDENEVLKHGERVSMPVLADAGAFMDALLLALQGGVLGADHQDWISQCDDWRVRYPWVDREHADQPPFINSYKFMEKLIAHFKSDQVVVTDMGTALLSGHQVLKFKHGHRFMTSTGLGEMGYGLPGAIGASFARDGGEVMCLNCDGGMMMNLQELQTVVHHNLPIKLFIFNNDGYLMIKHTQNNLFAGRQVGVNKSNGVSCPDFSALAQAFGMPAFQIRTWEDFDRVLPEVQAASGPVICEVFMHPQQLFLPKLSLAPTKDGKIVSPPLEDLSPLLPREEMQRNMLIGLHPKSQGLSPA
jgi:acetolactate synthase I/II/III large subunit